MIVRKATKADLFVNLPFRILKIVQIRIAQQNLLKDPNRIVTNCSVLYYSFSS